MGESNEERIARKKRERQEYLKRQAEIDKYLADRLDEDPKFAAEHDAAFDREFEELFGQKPYNYGVELDRELLKGQGVSEKDIDEAEKIMREARKIAKGTWMTSANPKKAAETLNNSAAVKKVAKAHKKSKGCVIVGLLILVVGSSSLTAAIYGAVQAVASVLP